MTRFTRTLGLLLTLLLLTTSCGFPLAQPTNPWWKDVTFYEIFVRSFADSNGDGIGDFNGVTSRLDYLQSLGVGAIWLMPIQPSPSYHGYDITDYYSVNPDYGTMDDFKRLLAEAHQRNIRVIIDLVLNHTSSQHPFFKDALQGPQSKYYNWYLWSNSNQGTGWHPIQQGGVTKYYFGIFCDCMPDLNYNNPEVTAQMENVARFWLTDIGVDGFRVDAANRLIEDGIKTENTPATHEWLKGFHTSYKADNPNAYVIGEVYGADASLAKTYTGNQMDAVFNFELASGIINSVNGGSVAGINSALTFATQTLPGGDYGTFLTNHDQNRTMSQFYGNVEKAKVATALLLTSPGVPFIYYGEEIGMTGEKPDEKIRTPMQWSGGTNAGFTTGTPWEPINPDFSQGVNVAKEETDSNSLLSTYRALLRLRNEHPALRTGDTILLPTGNTQVFALLRVQKGDKILVLTNLGAQSIRDYKLDWSTSSIQTGRRLSPLFGGDIESNVSAQPVEELAPYSTYIFQIQ